MTAAIARYNKVTQKAETDAKRLAVGDERLAHGDVRVACMIYARLAATHPPTEATEAAKKKVAELQEEAKQKLEELDRQLAAAHSEPRKARQYEPGRFGIERGRRGWRERTSRRERGRRRTWPDRGTTHCRNGRPYRCPVSGV